MQLIKMLGAWTITLGKPEGFSLFHLSLTVTAVIAVSLNLT